MSLLCLRTSRQAWRGAAYQSTHCHRPRAPTSTASAARSFNTMTFGKPQTSHEERTADSSRGGLIEVNVHRIVQQNDQVRLIYLQPKDTTQSIPFLPGQWLDVFVPGLSRAGGFTITSTPRDVQPASSPSIATATSSPAPPPYLELAIQKTRNPPAEYLWQPASQILHQTLRVRVGGNFTWPPPHLETRSIKRLVLVAGGVGINPLIAILRHLVSTEYAGLEEIVFLYSTKVDPGRPVVASRILFLEDIVALRKDAGRAALFVTGGVTEADLAAAEGLGRGEGLHVAARRIAEADLLAALGSVEQRAGTVCYICGPPPMTDGFVEMLSAAEGMHSDRVLCEKWW